MAREKGMGSLQQEKSGRFTLRVSIEGKRLSCSTHTTDRAQAERFLQRYLAPFGLGERRLPLCNVWNEYLKSPNRRDVAPSTLASKHLAWRHFASWMAENFPSIQNLPNITHDMIAAYLASLRIMVCASTYNIRVCILREMFHTLLGPIDPTQDPWSGVCLRNDDSHSRREFTLEEIHAILAAAQKYDSSHPQPQPTPQPSPTPQPTPTPTPSPQPTPPPFTLLFLIGIHTGLRLGDCCQLQWKSINFARAIIQVIPQKTKTHAHNQPITIPIHPELAAVLSLAPHGEFVIPALAHSYKSAKWHIYRAFHEIFKMAGITTSVLIKGRRRLTPDATFHSLRHTFVSIAANAGIPLTLIQSIVGHESTAMTRHYYHVNETELRNAITTLPNLLSSPSPQPQPTPTPIPTPIPTPFPQPTPQPQPSSQPQPTISTRLTHLQSLLDAHTITPEEYTQHRARILNDI